MVAIAAIPAMPANTDALATFPWLHSFADSIDNSNDFVSRHTRILNTGPESFLDQRIAVTNAARLDLDLAPIPVAAREYLVQPILTVRQHAEPEQHAF